MKKLTLIASLFVIFWLQSCKTVTENRETDCVTVLMDVTDSFSDVANINANNILPVFRISHDSLFGARVTIAPITNLRFNQNKTVYIPSENMIGLNEFDRKEAIKAFKKDLDFGLGVYNKKVVGTDGSYIFFAIANALNDLTGCKECDTKTLIIYSDCREKSKLFDSYNKESVKFMQKYPEKVSAVIDKNWPIQKSLEGVRIFIEHHPTSTTEDDLFYLMSGFMQSYYESKGAKVSINNMPSF